MGSFMKLFVATILAVVSSNLFTNPAVAQELFPARTVSLTNKVEQETVARTSNHAPKEKVCTVNHARAFQKGEIDDLSSFTQFTTESIELLLGAFDPLEPDGKDLRPITKLTVPLTKALVEFHEDKIDSEALYFGLDLNDVTHLSDECAVILSKSRGTIFLRGLKELSEMQAIAFKEGNAMIACSDLCRLSPQSVKILGGVQRSLPIHFCGKSCGVDDYKEFPVYQKFRSAFGE